MPIHDWTRVSAGTFHAFHLAWIAEIQATLNGGVLPGDYYAQAEQIVGPLGPDVFRRGIQRYVSPFSLAACLFLLLSWTVLPAEKSHRHYLSVGLVIFVLFVAVGYS